MKYLNYEVKETTISVLKQTINSIKTVMLSSFIMKCNVLKLICLRNLNQHVFTTNESNKPLLNFSVINRCCHQ